MEIVNKRRHKPTPRDVYIGRPSPLGNPFRIGLDGDRQAVIDKYRAWLLTSDDDHCAAAWAEIGTLPADAVLVCWCRPAACHGDVIAELHARVNADEED